MQTIEKILLFGGILCMVTSCSEYDTPFEEDVINSDLKKGMAGTTAVTLPFMADFTGNYMPETGVYPEVCGEYPMIRVFNEGGGNGTHLGKFTHYFDFCCNNETGEYPAGYMIAYLTAANGDILFMSCEGIVIEGKAPDHPWYVTSYFRDPWVIMGGTGRFEGASGSGMTDDYNSSLDPWSHHHWTGTITLVKSKN